MLYVVGLLAVGFSAVTGALAAEGRRMDLFGVLVLALVTSLGGGTLRDLVLDVPVFWSTDDWFLWTGLAAGTLTFAAVRYWHPPHQFLLIADAIGLAFVAVLGTEKGARSSNDCDDGHRARSRHWRRRGHFKRHPLRRSAARLSSGDLLLRDRCIRRRLGLRAAAPSGPRPHDVPRRGRRSDLGVEARGAALEARIAGVSDA